MALTESTRRGRTLASLRHLGGRFWRSQSGATAVEYAVLAGMIAVFAVAIGTVGRTLAENYFDNLADGFTDTPAED